MPPENTIGSAGFEPERPTANDCLTEQEIDHYLQGFLAVEDMEKVEAHIALCPECLSRFEEEADFRKTVAAAARIAEKDTVGTDTLEKERRRRETAPRALPATPWWQGVLGTIHRRWGYVAAASLVAIGLIVLSPGLRESRSPQSVALDVVRSADTHSTAEPDRPLILRANLAGLDVKAGAQFLLVDSTGAVIASQPIAAGTQEAVWHMSAGIPLGAYWVRIASSSDRSAILREFALEIR